MTNIFSSCLYKPSGFWNGFTCWVDASNKNILGERDRYSRMLLYGFVLRSLTIPLYSGLPVCLQTKRRKKTTKNQVNTQSNFDAEPAA